ncbi:hypothetical protein HYC85_029614 [Camellia sinensis]|uniref:Uncharacterized protein n=1 Tax=Camellia sinensis TaxID=4442 RepID=A0A7J7FYE5_CAMSI|nr:hypothetical protein HYC85_029614 [Camellia sinensis]
MVGGLPLPIKLVGGVPHMPTKVPANFGKDWSPRDLKKYKRSALPVAKSFRRNLSFNFQCLSYHYSSQVRCILFEHVVTPPGGEPEVAIESPSPKRAFPCSLFCDEHTSGFTLVPRYHAHNLHSHAHTCIVMHVSLTSPSLHA